MQQLQAAVTKLMDDFLESMEARECPQCRKDITPLVRKLKENITSEIEAHYIKPFPKQESTTESNCALIKLKIVLLRKINKLLEENPEVEGHTKQEQELSRLYKAIADIDQKLNSKQDFNLDSSKSSLFMSPISKNTIHISQSPLFQANKTLRFEFGETTLNNTTLDLSFAPPTVEKQTPKKASPENKKKDVESCKGEKTRNVTGKEIPRSKSTQPMVKNQKPIKVVKKIKMKNKENISMNSKEGTEEEKQGVKGLKLSEPQLTIVDNDKMKIKLEASMKKTPLSHISSMLNKIKMGEI